MYSLHNATHKHPSTDCTDAKHDAKSWLRMQTGALEVFAILLTSLPQANSLLSSSLDDDDDSDDDSESTVVQEAWSAAVGVLSQVVVHSPEGCKQILQVQQ